MKKTIVLNDTEMTFKSSAATNILYKRAFKEDVLVKIAAYTKNLKELKSIQEKVKAVREDTTKSKEEILATMQELMQSDAFTASTAFTSETLPRLAFIMYLEANTDPKDIFSKLTEEDYLSWLLTIEQNDLLSVTGQIMEIWQAGTKTTSLPKN